MFRFYFTFNGQSKDLGQSKGGSDTEACADYRQVINAAWEFLPGRTEFDDSAPMRGDAGVVSAISPC